MVVSLGRESINNAPKIQVSEGFPYIISMGLGYSYLLILPLKINHSWIGKYTVRPMDGSWDMAAEAAPPKFKSSPRKKAMLGKEDGPASHWVLVTFQGRAVKLWEGICRSDIHEKNVHSFLKL